MSNGAVLSPKVAISDRAVWFQVEVDSFWPRRRPSRHNPPFVYDPIKSSSEMVPSIDGNDREALDNFSVPVCLPGRISHHNPAELIRSIHARSSDSTLCVPTSSALVDITNVGSSEFLYLLVVEGLPSGGQLFNGNVASDAPENWFYVFTKSFHTSRERNDGYGWAWEDAEVDPTQARKPLRKGHTLELRHSGPRPALAKLIAKNFEPHVANLTALILLQKLLVRFKLRREPFREDISVVWNKTSLCVDLAGCS